MALSFVERCTDPAKCRSMDGVNGMRLSEPMWTDSWISPEGQQYSVECGMHAHVVRCHLPMENHNLTIDNLEAMGWLHFSTDFNDPIANETIRFTQSQLTTVFSIYMDGLNLNNNTGHHRHQLEVIQRHINTEGK